MTDQDTATTSTPPAPTAQAGLTAQARGSLIALLRAAYPHAAFPDGPYERTADAIIGQLDASLWHRLSLINGLESLDEAAGGAFADLGSEEAERVLRGLADAEFFTFVRGVAVTTLYNDPEVWDLLGWEGESYSQGGYLHRGFDDLDWLPDARVEEYDGPDGLVDVAPENAPGHGPEGAAR